MPEEHYPHHLLLYTIEGLLAVADGGDAGLVILPVRIIVNSSGYESEIPL